LAHQPPHVVLTREEVVEPDDDGLRRKELRKKNQLIGARGGVHPTHAHE
jgi:hypothetical protein